jgi:hypothetical protein
MLVALLLLSSCGMLETKLADCEHARAFVTAEADWALFVCSPSRHRLLRFCVMHDETSEIPKPE